MSCASAGNCTAIGEYADESGIEQGLLLTQRNGAWARGMKARLPANAATAKSKESYVLWSLSCTSAGNCLAVGWYVDKSGSGDPLLLSEKHGTWERGVEARLRPNAAAKPIYGADELESVSCASAGNCTAVGSYSTRSKMEVLLLTERNGNWAAATEALLPTNGAQATYTVSDRNPAVFDVSCASAGNCSAIGSYADSGHHPHGLLMSETGDSWSRGSETRLP